MPLSSTFKPHWMNIVKCSAIAVRTSFSNAPLAKCRDDAFVQIADVDRGARFGELFIGFGRLVDGQWVPVLGFQPLRGDRHFERVVAVARAHQRLRPILKIARFIPTPYMPMVSASESRSSSGSRPILKA